MATFKNLLRQFFGRRCRLIIELYYSLRYWCFYRGDLFVCPCCTARLSRFLKMTTPLEASSNAGICPRCDSHPRQRLLWLFFNEHCRDLFGKNWRILHLAPEFCFERHFRRGPSPYYVTGDLSSPQVDVRIDVCRMPFAANQFDVVLCNHVLEHVPADREAISELFRVLCPGGWALMQVPIDWSMETTLEDPDIVTPEDRTRYYGQDDHVRMYGRDFVDRIRRAGFSVDTIDYVAGLNPDLVKYHGLPSRELIYLCRKPAALSVVAGE